MRIAVVGHSMVHVRQQNFFREVARLGHEVTVIAPGEWRDLRAQDRDEAAFHLRTVRHFGGEDIYQYRLVGVERALATGPHDYVYVHAEPNSQMALDGLLLAGRKHILFTWENIAGRVSLLGQEVVKRYNLVVCGNDECEAIVKPYAPRTVVLPQVGVDVEHFQARPGVLRHIPVAYIGRHVEEKGINQLLAAWPTAQTVPWTEYRQLPWRYSECQVVVNFSQDSNWWREQAMPYTSVEAICCGAVAILSDAGSIPFWHQRFAPEPDPGAVLVSWKSALALRKAIGDILQDEERRKIMTQRGREWVESYLSSRVIAKRLIEALEG